MFLYYKTKYPSPIKTYIGIVKKAISDCNPTECFYDFVKQNPKNVPKAGAFVNFTPNIKNNIQTSVKCFTQQKIRYFKK